MNRTSDQSSVNSNQYRLRREDTSSFHPHLLYCEFKTVIRFTLIEFLVVIAIIAILAAMQSEVIRIPDDLSGIGFNDTAGLESGLTTFNIQEHVIASTAAELLFEDQSDNKKIYIKPGLILRESVRPL